MERDLVQSSDANVTSAQPCHVFLDEKFVVLCDVSDFNAIVREFAAYEDLIK